MLIILQNIMGSQNIFFHKVIKGKEVILQTLILRYIPEEKDHKNRKFY